MASEIDLKKYEWSGTPPIRRSRLVSGTDTAIDRLKGKYPTCRSKDSPPKVGFLKAGECKVRDYSGNSQEQRLTGAAEFDFLWRRWGVDNWVDQRNVSDFSEQALKTVDPGQVDGRYIYLCRSNNIYKTVGYFVDFGGGTRRCVVSGYTNPSDLYWETDFSILSVY